ncbi:MAG: LysR family transcriptional regulator [Haliangiales bacterium]
MHALPGRFRYTAAVNLDQLRAFVAVVEHGTFTAAAERLEISKQSVSRRISDLETEINTALLVRSSRGVKCTPAGLEFVDRVRAALGELEGGLQQLHSREQEPRGSVWVGAPALFAKHFLSPVVSAFLARYQHMRVGVCALGGADTLDFDHLDIIITIGRLPDIAAKRVRLGTAINGCYAAPSYLRENGTPEAPGDLSAHACLAYSRHRSAIAWRLSRGDQVRKIAVDARLTANDAEVILDAAVRGAGVAHLPHFICQEAVASGQLQRVLPGWDLAVGEINALYLDSRAPRRELALMLKAIRTALGGRRAAAPRVSET